MSATHLLEGDIEKFKDGLCDGNCCALKRRMAMEVERLISKTNHRMYCSSCDEATYFNSREELDKAAQEHANLHAKERDDKISELQSSVTKMTAVCEAAKVVALQRLESDDKTDADLQLIADVDNLVGQPNPIEKLAEEYFSKCFSWRLGDSRGSCEKAKRALAAFLRDKVTVK